MGYSPIIGRFLQRDPQLYAAGPNLYEVERSNPIKYIDPMGMYPKGFSGPRPDNDPGDDGRTMAQYQNGQDALGRRPPNGKELDNLKTAICLLKGNAKYAKFGDVMEKMLADNKILVTDLGFNNGGATFGQTRTFTNGGAIEIDQNFAAQADCKNRTGLSELAGTLVHEWSHLTQFEGNPTGLNTIGKIIGGAFSLVPAGWDDDDNFVSLNERGPHNLGIDVRSQVQGDLKGDSPCCKPCDRKTTTQPTTSSTKPAQ